jgi:hypothetical protein
MNKISMYSIGIAGLAIVGLILIPSFAQAQSTNGNMRGNVGGYGYQKATQSKASALGMTADELRTQLQTKTLLQIAEEKGISEDQLHEKMQQSAQGRWKAMGLTQAEMDSRLQTMKERQAAGCENNNLAGGGIRHNRNSQ